MHAIAIADSGGPEVLHTPPDAQAERGRSQDQCGRRRYGHEDGNTRTGLFRVSECNGTCASGSDATDTPDAMGDTVSGWLTS